jgi:hypothetical protein
MSVLRPSPGTVPSLLASPRLLYIGHVYICCIALRFLHRGVMSPYMSFIKMLNTKAISTHGVVVFVLVLCGLSCLPLLIFVFWQWSSLWLASVLLWRVTVSNWGLRELPAFCGPQRFLTEPELTRYPHCQVGFILWLP